MQTTLFNAPKIQILETNEIVEVKKENEVFYVFWLNEPFYNKFNTLIDIGIISKDKVKLL